MRNRRDSLRSSPQLTIRKDDATDSIANPKVDTSRGTDLNWLNNHNTFNATNNADSPILAFEKSKVQLTSEEVAKHSKKNDLWIVLNGKVYNLTNFLYVHPGGTKVLEKNAGKDGSKIFNPIHASDAIEKYLPAECCLGDLMGEIEVKGEENSDEEYERLDRISRKPPLSSCINLYDLEYVAKQILPPAALAYYESAAEDEVTLREIHNVNSTVFFNPKILVDVSHVDVSAEFFGEKVSAPFYVSATALNKLDLSDQAVKDAEVRGAKAIFITVDSQSLGREKDMKNKFEDDAAALEDDGSKWSDIKHFTELTKVPIVIKGIERVENVFLAIEHGVQGIVLPNHGGRQLDYTIAPSEVLADVISLLREKGLDKKVDIFIDSGIRRGTDVLKAPCLGAKGVGLAYGEAGVQKACQMLKEELRMNMRLLGVTKISELSPDLLDIRNLYSRAVAVPNDYLYYDNYYKMKVVQFKSSG